MAGTNKTKYAILGVLSLISGSGYDIKKFCDFSIAHFWHENYGHIYPVLKQLEQDGFVSKKTEQAEGRPQKFIYSLTEGGQVELNKWLQLPVEYQSVRSELLLKLFFASDIPIENIIEKIKKEKAVHEGLLEEYQKAEETLKANEPYKSSKDLPLWLSTISFGKYESKARIEWCNETIRYLGEMQEN